MSTAPDQKPPKKPEPDWASIEFDYRAGVKPLRTIAEQHGISHAAIQKRAKRDDWSRDLSARIQAKADQLVAKHAVAAQVAKLPETRQLETDVINANAKAIYDVRIGHRKNAARALNLTTILLGDLEAVSSPEGQGLVESLIDSLTVPEDGKETAEQAARRRVANRKTLDRALTLDSRVDTAKKLADTFRILIDIERQAFGITDKTPEEGAAGALKNLNVAERASRIANLLASARERANAQATDVESKEVKSAT